MRFFMPVHLHGFLVLGEGLVGDLSFRGELYDVGNFGLDVAAQCGPLRLALPCRPMRTPEADTAVLPLLIRLRTFLRSAPA